MKSIKLLFALVLILAGVSGFSQTATLQINGHVTELQTGLPVGNHMVAVTVFTDSIHSPEPVTDSAFTDPSGYYGLTLIVPYTPGTAAFLIAGTFDCHMSWLQQFFVYTNNQSVFTADFSICTDSIPPPSPCENNILLTGVQGLIASFHGSLINGMPASYLWQLGDGNVATGQNVTHMYASQGIYTVSLQTVTADGCTDSSGFTLMLMDTIPNGCASYFVATPTGNPKEMDFNAYTQSNYPTEFTWELGDGTTATGQNLVHTYCCEGTYTILLTTTDSTGCSSTYTAPIVVTLDSTGTLMLGGQVFAGSNPIDFGMISLFRVDPSGSYFPVQTKLIDSLGFYNFWNLYFGTYLILAYPPPDSLSGNSYLPTYYGDVVFWEQATPISLGVPLNPYNINLVSYDSIGGGPGSVSGQLISGGKSISTGNMEVLLLDAYGTPVRITYTDPMGNFSFTSLPYGQYMVNPVVTGITVQTSPIILSATNPSVVVIMTINGNTITGISKKGKAPMVGGIHPNPATDQVLVTLNAIGNIKIQISDASGRIVISETRNLSETGSEVTIHVKDLNPGLYFISIQDSEGNVSTSKMVKN